MDELRHWDEWEDSKSFRDPFTATVLRQGAAVEAALEPAFRASSFVGVVDPYLIPDKKPDVARQFLAYCRSLQKVEVVAMHLARPNNAPHRDRARSIGEWLLTEVPSLLPDVLEVTWHLLKRNARVHDRFLGFTVLDARERPPWHAVSLGFGVESLAGGERLVCVARISKQHFAQVWEQARQRSSWRVFVERHPPKISPAGSRSIAPPGLPAGRCAC